MKTIAFAAAVAALFAAGAAAQQARPARSDPADPAATVPAPAYCSVFQDLPSGVEQDAIDWRQANADVARFARGHADYVKWEERQGGARAADASPAATAPASRAAPAARPQGHRQHQERPCHPS